MLSRSKERREGVAGREATGSRALIQHQACQDLKCLKKGKYWNKADLGLRNEINFIGVQENVAEV